MTGTEGTFPKTDGDTLFASEVNGFNDKRIHIKEYESNVEEETDVSDELWHDTSKTFTLSAPTNSYVLNVFIKGDFSYTAASGLYSLKINGSNLGTKYIVFSDFSNIISNTDNNGGTNSFIDSVETGLFSVNLSSYHTAVTNLNQPFKILDTSTTFIFRCKGSAGDLLIKNAKIVVTYATPVTED